MTFLKVSLIVFVISFIYLAVRMTTVNKYA